MKIAIIGAGMAGLTCAREASLAGHTVTVFDKGRGAGGRLSTRRLDATNGQLRFDHGTMGFKTRTTEFSNAAKEWLSKGWIGLWSPRIGLLGKQDVRKIPGEKWVVGVPAMNNLIKQLCEGLDVRFGTRISDITHKGNGWQLQFDNKDDVFDCDVVISAVPAEQAATLLESIAPAIAEEARNAISLPCWSVMLGYDAPLGLDYDLVLGNGRPFTRLIRNSSKPGRAPDETWVLQAGPEWSAEHIDLPPKDIINKLETEFERVMAINVPASFKAAHRWRYALNAIPASAPFFWDETARIGSCGDWHIGAEVQDAWMSGKTLGEQLAQL